MVAFVGFKSWKVGYISEAVNNLKGVFMSVRFMLAVSVTIFSLLISFNANGCGVPVFRYALERWPSDPYRITVFHKGDLTPTQKKVISYYKKFNNDYVSIIFSVIDLKKQGLKKDVKRYWAEHKQDKLPVVFVDYPVQARVNKTLAGVYPLDMKSAKQLMESPAGREIARRILKDDSSVFLQIDCGDEAENLKSEKIVKSAFEKMKNDIELSSSEFDSSGTSDDDSDTPKVKFSFLRISRKNVANRAFIDILLNSENGLSDIKGPIVFPIYGRARALFAFSGEGINRDNLMDAGTFLTGECSCEIKGQNPGIDLLVPINWDDFIHYEVNIDDELPPLTGLASTLIEEKKQLEVPAEKIDLKKISEIDKEPTKSPLLLNMLLAFIGLIALFAIIAVSIKNKGSKKQ